MGTLKLGGFFLPTFGTAVVMLRKYPGSKIFAKFDQMIYVTTQPLYVNTLLKDLGKTFIQKKQQLENANFQKLPEAFCGLELL